MRRSMMYRVYGEIRGYKIIGKDWRCRNFQYSCPGRFRLDGKIAPCERGFHFCRKLSDCFSYYAFGYENEYHVCEVIARSIIYGLRSDGSSKLVTNDIDIVRELSHSEIISLINTGETTIYGIDNTGHNNFGNYNSGNWNHGHRNTGDFNDGPKNTGDFNIGYRNTGSNNVGNFNTGNYNIGDGNTGYFNRGDQLSGCFCTKQPFMLFNKPADGWDIKMFKSTIGYHTMCDIPTNNVVIIRDRETVDDLETLTRSDYDVFPGVDDKFLPAFGMVKKEEALLAERQEWWDNKLTQRQRRAVTSLPNFDSVIFKEITGISVSASDMLGPPILFDDDDFRQKYLIGFDVSSGKAIFCDR